MQQDLFNQAVESEAMGRLDHLRNHVQSTLGGRVRDLQLLLRDRGIVLRGFARTFYAKQLAQHAVMTETRLPIVSNEIEVS